MFEKIIHRTIEFPDYLSVNAKDLIDNLIQVDPEKRWGSPTCLNDIKSLKNHPFFDGIDFNNLSGYNVVELVQKEKVEKSKSEQDKKQHDIN